MDEVSNDGPLTFPKKADRERISAYRKNDMLYYGNHFEAFGIRGQAKLKDQMEYPEVYRRLRYVVANFAGLQSRVMADMVFGEQLVIDFADEKTQAFIDKVMEDNQFMTQLYESALANSRRGDTAFKVRIGQMNPAVAGSPATVIIEEFSPEYYFPEFDRHSSRNVPKAERVAHYFKSPDGKSEYVHFEIHTPGRIEHEVWSYAPGENKLVAKLDPVAFGYPETEETGVSGTSMLKHAPNVRDGGGFFGTSDYLDIQSLMFALNNRISKTDNILDKHSDPILAVPPGVIDENGQVRKEALGMFEVENDNPGFNKPEYIVWNANLEAAFKEIDKLVEFLFMFSEISPATTGNDQSAAKAESGRALKFRLLATIRKRNRKIRYYDQLVKDILVTALEAAVANNVTIDGLSPGEITRPTIKWPDGIVNDEVEQTEVVGQRIDQGTISRADAIVRLDGGSSKEAEEKVKEIDKESAAVDPISNNLDGNGTGGAGNDNSNPQE